MAKNFKIKIKNLIKKTVICTLCIFLFTTNELFSADFESTDFENTETEDARKNLSNPASTSKQDSTAVPAATENALSAEHDATLEQNTAEQESTAENELISAQTAEDAQDATLEQNSNAGENTTTEQNSTDEENVSEKDEHLSSQNSNKKNTLQNQKTKKTPEKNTTHQNKNIKTEKQKNIFQKEQTEEVVAETEEESEETLAQPLGPVFKPLDIEFTDEALNHPLTQKFLEQYQAESSKKYLTAIMKNSYPYRAYIQKSLEEANMPTCLQYLPVIESGYKINALSKSGAKGIWQFMMNSISPYGMKVNMWLDERIDPWISTQAALKKLQENYEILGSWEMALAAYNSGLGAMRRAIKNGETDNYWELCEKGFIRPESKNYVPKFIAVATILSNKEIYGLEFDEVDKENDKSVHFDTILVSRNIDLKVLSEKSSISYEDLRYYNPSLVYGITPPSISYQLRLPEGTKEQVDQLMKTSIPLVKYHIYTVKSGDSIYALARHYGVPESEIQRVNKINGTTIKIGQRLMIPAYKEVSEFSRPQNTEKIDFSGTYTVTDSDTLWSLALKYNIPVEVLASENNMEITDILHIGSTIKVPIIKQ